MLKHECTVGKRVRVSSSNDVRWHGQTGAIEKVNSVNVKVRLDSGVLLTVNPSYLSAEGVPVTPPAHVEAFAYVAPPVIGAVVTCSHEKVHGPHVVIGETTAHGRPVVKIAKLGGDGNRYWRVPAAQLTVIDHFNLELV